MPTPDVLALQEADRETVRAGGVHVVAELARGLGAHFVRAAMPTPLEERPKKKQWYLDFEEPISPGETGDTGVAILSRLPLGEVSRVELPWSECPWRPRLALTASVPFGKGSLRIFNAHVDPHAGLSQQLAQHETILASVEEMGTESPVALMGDFNTLSRKARVETRAFLEARGFFTPLPTGIGTWRAGPLRLHADWIFLRGACPLRWGVAHPSGISDHWPVWAEIESLRD